MAGFQINPDSNLDKEMRTTRFFNLYFSKFKYIVLSNFLFLVPVLIAAAYIYGTYIFFDGLNIIASTAAIILLNPFVAGLTLVSRYIYTEKEFSVVKTFFRGIKENWAKFLAHGVILYAVFAISYFSIGLYYSGTKSNVLFWVPLAITAIIALFALFSSYYTNIMTVTMDIKLKDIYRNCALFSFGELKNNIFVTFALLIFAAVIFTLAVILNNPLAFLIIVGVLTVFIIPSTIQYIITFYVYDNMVGILDKSKKNERKSKAEKASVKTQVDKDEAEEISRLAPQTQDEYIFHNGKMIKRSAVEKQLQENMDDDFN